MTFVFITPDGRRNTAHIGHSIDRGDIVSIDGADYLIDGPARLERVTLFNDVTEWQKVYRVSAVAKETAQ
jgi:hypothetical protein